MNRFIRILLLLSLTLFAFLVSAQSEDLDLPELDSTFTTALEDGTVRLTFYRTGEELECELDDTERYVGVPEVGIFDLVNGQAVPNIEGQRYYDFSPDGNYLAVDTEGIYELNTGELVAGFPEGYYVFSPTGTYVAITGTGEFATTGIYEVNTQTRMDDVPGAQTYFGAYGFSQDEAYLFVRDSGVFQIDDGVFTRLNSIPPNAPSDLAYGLYRFDPTSTYVGVFGVGIYRLEDETFLDIPPSTDTENTYNAYVFDPDAEYVAVLWEGVYNLIDETHLETVPYDLNYSYFFGDEHVNVLNFDNFSESPGAFTLEDGSPIENLIFNSPDGEHRAVRMEGVYPIGEDEPLPGIPPAFSYDFSPDGQYVVINSAEVYEVASGELVDGIPESDPTTDYIFSGDGQYVALEGDGIYSLADGETVLAGLPVGTVTFGMRSVYVELVNEEGTTNGCAVYAAPDNIPNVGTVNAPGGINLRSTPEILPDNIADVTAGTAPLPLHGVSPDGEWYLITYNGAQVWAAGAVLPTNSLPEMIPVIEE